MMYDLSCHVLVNNLFCALFLSSRKCITTLVDWARLRFSPWFSYSPWFNKSHQIMGSQQKRESTILQATKMIIQSKNARPKVKLSIDQFPAMAWSMRSTVWKEKLRHRSSGRGFERRSEKDNLKPWNSRCGEPTKGSNHHRVPEQDSKV